MLFMPPPYEYTSLFLGKSRDIRRSLLKNHGHHLLTTPIHKRKKLWKEGMRLSDSIWTFSQGFHDRILYSNLYMSQHQSRILLIRHGCKLLGRVSSSMNTKFKGRKDTQHSQTCACRKRELQVFISSSSLII